MTATDLEPHPWERQPGETDKAWQAFQIYRELGPGRTMGEVARQLGKHEQQIHRWARAYLWVDRILQMDQWLDRQWTNAKVGERLAATQRQLRTVRAASGLGVQWLTDVRRRLEAGQRPPDSVMAKLLMDAMAAERDLLGIGETDDSSDLIEVVMVDARMFPSGAAIAPDDSPSALP